MKIRPFKIIFFHISHGIVLGFIIILILGIPFFNTPLLTGICWSNDLSKPAALLNLQNHPVAAKILQFARQANIKASFFGGTSRDIILNKKIQSNDEYDILLPPDFIEGELTLEQRDFIKGIETIAGHKNRCHFIYYQGRENFKKLYSIGGLSINKIVISSDLKIIDRNNGLRDLKNKLLRHVPGADNYWPSFLPVYDVLRGIRFLSQYPDFTLDPMTSKYYYQAVDKFLNDSRLILRILTIFKNISQNKQHSDKFPGNGKDFIRTKVQIRSIKKRLDKIFDYAVNPEKAEKLLEQFNLINLLKRLRWPEKDYVVSKMDPKRFAKKETPLMARTGFIDISKNKNIPLDIGVPINIENIEKPDAPFEQQELEQQAFVNDTPVQNNWNGTTKADVKFDVSSSDDTDTSSLEDDNFVDPFEDIDFEDFDLEDF